MELSTHKVEVFRIDQIYPHNNADKLEIIKPWGYQCVVQKGLHKVGDLAAYVPPDSIVDTTRSEFTFLGDHKRTKARRFRGEWSQGIILNAPSFVKEGDNLAEYFGVTHYEPPVRGEKEDNVYKRRPKGFYKLVRWYVGKWWDGFRYVRETRSASAPTITVPKYDVDNWRRYKHLFTPGEVVIATEKIHGANARFTFDGKLHVGSRTLWKRNPNSPAPKVKWYQKYVPATYSADIWWLAINKHPEVVEWLEKNVGYIIYGEVFGQMVQAGFDYGVAVGSTDLRVFDIKDPQGNWLEYDKARDVADSLPWVPQLHYGEYDEEKIVALTEGKTTIGGKHIREGIVLQPKYERTDPHIGRVKLKLVSNKYLEGS